MPDDLAYVSASEALNLFSRAELSPVEYLEATIARIERSEGMVNALSEVTLDVARTEARTSEQRYRTGENGLLEGLPVATKEEQPLVGRSWTEGSLWFRNRTSEVTHPIIDRILAAGGIIHARTTVPEFCAAGFTHSDLWGVSRNPWNLTYSPGGSSGGAGAALAAGYAPLATGSDIGGSIRIPAGFNGVVGYKPPYGRVPGLPPASADPYCADGPMARSVDDCALLQNVIAGQHPRDMASLRTEPPIAIRADVADLRIAHCPTLGNYPVEAEVQLAVKGAADNLRAAGAVVEDIEVDWDRESIMEAAWTHYGVAFGSLLMLEESDGAPLMPYTRDAAGRATEAMLRNGPLFAIEFECRIQRDLAAIFADYDAMICPTAGTTGFLAGEDYTERSLVVAGESLGHPFESVMTIPFNMASRCPVLNVPVGRGANRLPIGMQVVGRPYDDHLIFCIGKVLEQFTPWFETEAFRPDLQTLR